MPQCPICFSRSVPEPKQDTKWTGYDCHRCGRWSIDAESAGLTDELPRYLGDWDTKSRRLRSRLSHIVRRQQDGLAPGTWFHLSLHKLESWHLDEPLPSPAEQLDQLILLVGERQPSPDDAAQLAASEVSAWIGAMISQTSSELDWLLKQQQTMELLDIPLQSRQVHEMFWI
jgi:hypothetical protein